jgi:hypothetical protein
MARRLGRVNEGNARVAPGALTAVLVVAVSCARPAAAPAPIDPPRQDATVFVIDGAGMPAAGVKVFWAQTGFSCEGFGPGSTTYTFGGQGTTDATGRAIFSGMVPWIGITFAFQVGRAGERTLGSLNGRERAKVVPLLPTVRLDLALRCEAGPCDRVAVRGHIVRDGGSCMINVEVPAGADQRIALAGLPQGDLEITFRVDEARPTEGLAVFRQRLDADLSTTVTIATVGGPEVLTGRVLFPDGSPPGGKKYDTSLNLACSNGLSRHGSPDPATGAFEMRALPAVPCTLSADVLYRPGRWASVPILLTPGRTSPPTLTLREVRPR